MGFFPSLRFHHRHANAARHVRRPPAWRCDSRHSRNATDRHRNFLHDACALVAARDQHRNRGDAFAALDCDRGMGLDGVCHHSHARKQQCLHLLPILSASFGCRVCSSANRRKPRASTAVHRSSSSARSRKFPGAASLLLLCCSLSLPRLPGNSTAARLVTDPLWMTTRISGLSRGGALNPSRSLSSAILVDGTIWISTNCKKGWVNARCNWRWPEVALIRSWLISPTIKLFTARLFAVSCPVCFLPRRAHPPWSAGKKPCAGLIRNLRHNAPANIWRCPWKNMSHFSSSKTSRSSSF